VFKILLIYFFKNQKFNCYVIVSEFYKSIPWRLECVAATIKMNKKYHGVTIILTKTIAISNIMNND